MMLFENIRIALVELWANRLRSLLAVLGIFIATAATISVVSIVLGFNQYISAMFLASKDTVYLWPDMPRGSNRMVARFTPLKPEDAATLKDMVPEIRRSAVNINTSSTLVYRGHEFTANVVGFSEDGMAIEGGTVLRGRPFTEATFRSIRSPCWIGDDFATGPDMAGDPIGQVIELGGEVFTIAGVTDLYSQRNMDKSTVVVAMPYTAFCRVFGNYNDYANRILVQKHEAASPAQAETAIRRAMRRLHDLTGNEPDDFEVRSVSSFQEKFTSFISVSGGILFAIVGVSLLVGGIGIMNIMLVSVRERTREIGIRMAVGARRRDILMQFLVESITLCSLGGLLGIISGQTFALAVTRLIGLLAPEFGEVYFSWWLIGGSLAFSASVGIIFGVLPARDASKLDPIEALRFS